MTAYSVTASGATLGIRATNFEVRIIQIVTSSNNTDSVILSASRYDSSPLTTGTALTAAPLRKGAPTVSATARSGVGTPVGTRQLIQQYLVAKAADIDVIGSSYVVVHHGTSAQLQPPLAVTILPGGVFHLTGATDVTSTIYFEELRLSGSL